MSLMLEDQTIEGAFLVRDNRVFNGPLGRSLRLFARTARSVHGFADSLRSLPRGTVEIHMCSCCIRVPQEQTRFLFSLETRTKSFLKPPRLTRRRKPTTVGP